MSTQAVIDQLQREIAQLRNQVLAKRYGVGSEALVLVLGEDSAEQAIERRLANVPHKLRDRIKVRTVCMPWLNGRCLSSGDSIIQTQERQVVA
ncbi:MAG: hypothetical protein EB072_16650 [Betaproteobacteria bacterium]|nr:hypothetical protein [Betaproteobacteria bacterium]